jgi:hypothetical protein
MAGLSASRNTPEWTGAQRIHLGLLPVEASTSVYVGSMVAIDASGNAVPAQAISGSSTLRRLQIAGICEYVYAGGVLPPGIDALNQTANGALFPGATATVGTAGAISVGVATGIFGMDHDSTVTAAQIGQIVFASDDHTVTLGTLTANTTNFTVPASGLLANALKPHIVPGTLDAYSATGAGGTHYVEGTDYSVDYQAGIFWTISGGAILAGGTVYVTYYSGVAKMAVGILWAIDGGLAYINMLQRLIGYGF